VRVLLDTHVFLWWVLEDPRLSPVAQETITDPDVDVLVSPVSAWEIAIKAADGRLDLPEPPLTYVPSRMAANAFHELPIKVGHCLRTAELPGIHRDAFDRILVAQAQIEGMPIVTNDPAITGYDVEITW
jgi:PIN domain nuclease of toxin-antitoxin system